MPLALGIFRLQEHRNLGPTIQFGRLPEKGFVGVFNPHSMLGGAFARFDANQGE